MAGWQDENRYARFRKTEGRLKSPFFHPAIPPSCLPANAATPPVRELRELGLPLGESDWGGRARTRQVVA